MKEEEYAIMAEAEMEHWWYRSLHNLVLSNIKKHFESMDINIIDAGCGTGGLMLFLKNNGYKNISGFDNSDLAVNKCVARGLPVFKGDLRTISKYYKENEADVIISNDTFYFLETNEQRTVADHMFCLLKKNGLLITNMPALKAFSGMHDLQVGIKKRFEKKDIQTIFDSNKYEKKIQMYWSFALSPLICIARFTQRLKMKYHPKAVISSDVKKEGKLLNSILFSITNTENRLFEKKPFGSSLFIVMKKYK